MNFIEAAQAAKEGKMVVFKEDPCYYLHSNNRYAITLRRKRLDGSYAIEALHLPYITGEWIEEQ